MNNGKKNGKIILKRKNLGIFTLFLLLTVLFDVFHVAGHNTLAFCSCHSYLRESLDNFIFLSSWRSFKWSFPVSRIILDSSKCPSITCDPCDISGWVDLLLVICYYVIYSSPFLNYFNSNVLMKRYSEQLPFALFVVNSHCYSFFVIAHVLLVCHVEY